MNKNVLFVDDDKHILNALRRSVRKTEWKVLFANSAVEAKAFFEEMTIDVLVSDITMPKINGVELMKEIGAKHPSVILIALTGIDDIGDVYEIFEEVNLYKYITKPWDPQQLVDIISEALAANQKK